MANRKQTLSLAYGGAACDTTVSQPLGRLPATSTTDNNGCGQVKPSSLPLVEWEMVKVVPKSLRECRNTLKTEFQADPAIPRCMPQNKLTKKAGYRCS